MTATLTPEIFNANGDENDPDVRSDNKGPEPEGLVLGQAFGKTFLFVGLERIGGIVTLDVTDPENPIYCDYKNRRNIGVNFGDVSAAIHFLCSSRLLSFM